MIAKFVLAAIIGTACASAASASSGHYLYGGVPLEARPDLERKFARALAHCECEAGSLPRGSLDPESLLYDTALRACLYRLGFFEGREAYPVRIFADR
ncbi:hypothetical protein LJR030_005220 [Rhizobium sp. LjRoot30]|uniref:hypothetical protein n=1 Tax=Rhizobium sp. LjRoot30 TaxID=3342320 RepID=UPI003ECE6819